ncbi:type III pantothenate kinase [Spongiibacter sp. KMU-158]|uniref:Type III pantothenate kinase n=1 Tax=Spongiibacter pelagi TaxID=2760804 RepID=A0A927C370_9GAMM|nr:type III pantothenate kinase [Spongiibacter pelagi]MBD2859313.1 type III pantothenate kinase [Spongiibacter pelagi]
MAEALLELDVGNSSLKWRKRCGVSVVDSGRLAWSELASLDAVLEDVQRVLVGSVAGESSNEILRDYFSGRGLQAEFAQSQVVCGPVKNAYADVARMGVDRWLAMVAAFREFSAACLVVDVGTALTLDMVSGEGVHHGGYIIPGPQMMLQALLSGTDRVRFAEEGAQTIAPGVITDECVHHGKWLALIGAVSQARQQMAALVDEAPLVVVAGGAGAALIAAAGSQANDWIYREDLVLDGLYPVINGWSA